MANRLTKLGYAVAVAGVVFLLASLYVFTQIKAGQNALQKFSEAQDIKLSYNEQGQLLERGKTEGVEPIKKLLTEDWGYPLKESELDPNDPLVNTASEYMYQMAVIAYHVTHGTQKIVLEKDEEYKGQTFPAGTYDFPVAGRYWTGFDRMHPIEGKARGQAWTGTAHALIAELGVGTVTASSLELGLLVTALVGGLGLTFIGLGLGLNWVAKES